MGMPVAITGVERAAAEEAFAWLRRVDSLFSTYRADSEISRLDRGALVLADCDPLVREVLERCETLRGLTAGYFDARATGRLDPSGFVKGWAVDRAAALLDAAGAERSCVNAGGDLVVRGGPWRVGIRHPRRRRRLAAALAVADAAVATSGAYERGAHVLDPHTGRPARGVLSITVVGPELATADAYATAAFAMGRAGPAWTAGLDGYEAMTVLDDGVLCTPGFAHLCGGSVAGSVSGGRLRSPGWRRQTRARWPA
jgi:thiamine biosynthesis lipoprotein